MSKLIPPPTAEEIKEFEKHIAKRGHYSNEFKAIFAWMFDLDKYTKAMRYKYECNPYIAMIKKESDEDT